MANIYYTCLLRFSQATLDAALTLVMGVIIAGIFRRMVGPVATRRLFGTGVKGSLRGWFAGMLLPVCSLGVIPVARELRRSGVPGGVVLAFVLTGPLLNPISFLYGLTLGEPKVILTFAVITLGKTAVVAYLWERWFGGSTDRARAVERAKIADALPMPGPGPRRIVAVLVTAARELAGSDILYYVIGLLGNAALASVIPFASLQRTMGHHDSMAPIRMLFLAIPAYISPLSGMVRIGSMFEHGNSIGAAFILLVLGIGMCLGTIVWLFRDFGRWIGPWFIVYACIVLGLAYACEPLLWNTAKIEVDHTHAFDDLSSPFYPYRENTPELMRALIRTKLQDKFQASEQLALGCLLALLAAGTALRLLDRNDRIGNWLTRQRPDDGRRRWDPALSGMVLASAAILGLFTFSIIGAYLYFPDRALCLEKMRYLSADTRDTVRQRQVSESIRYLEQWDLLARQLQVGVYIRSFGVTEQQAKTVDDLREAIEQVRDDLRANKLDEARDKLDHIVLFGEYRACYAAYAPNSSWAKGSPKI